MFQYTVRVNPMPPNKHIKHEDILKVAESNWYKYTLACGHEVYTKVRIRVAKDYNFQEHYIRCSVEKHTPLEWQAIAKMESVTDEQMSHVSSGSAFVLPRRILRVDGHKRDGSIYPSGNPFPYSSGDRDY